MRTIIHNLKDGNFDDLSDTRVLYSKNIKNCIGCFKCWTDNDTCILKDECFNNGKLLIDSDELIIISKCTNGCYESDIKKVLERSISYVEPYFKLKNKEMHHKTKTDREIDFRVFFYGEIPETDKIIATNLVNRNGINLYTKKPIVNFIKNYKEIKL